LSSLRKAVRVMYLCLFIRSTVNPHFAFCISPPPTSEPYQSPSIPSSTFLSPTSSTLSHALPHRTYCTMADVEMADADPKPKAIAKTSKGPAGEAEASNKKKFEVKKVSWDTLHGFQI